MVAKFCQFIAAENLFSTDDRLLVAVSGGLDSTALVYLLAKGGFSFGMAHCNFHLRGTESDGDAKFVRDLAKQLGVPFFEADLPVTDLRKAGESIQMCARRLRYDWLLETLQQNDYSYLLTAHHLYDSLETFLLNFVRGTGLAGLQGIPLQTGVVKRPLLFCARPQLENWVIKENIAYREDSSNAEEKYRRNRIRHQVLPILEEMNPALAETLFDNFSHLRSAYALYGQSLDHQIQEVLNETAEGWQLDRSLLKKQSEAAAILYEYLLNYGFTADQSKQLLSAKTGTILESEHYQVLVDGEHIVLRKRLRNSTWKIELTANDQKVSLPNGMVLEIEPLAVVPETYPDSASKILIDQSKLIYPIVLRYWQAGDEFQPLGMGGKHQKLQDFFVNNKINRFDRQLQALLFNGNGELIWIIAYRLDERYKITENTQAVLQLSVG